MENKNMIIIIAVLFLILLGVGVAYYLKGGDIKKNKESDLVPFSGEIKEAKDLKKLLPFNNNIKAMSYERVILDGPAEVFQAHYFQSGMKSRKEVYQKNELTEVVLVDAEKEKVVYQYFPQLNVAVKRDISKMSEKEIQNEFFGGSAKENFKMTIEEDIKIVGFDSLDGMRCVIVEFVQEDFLFNPETEENEKIDETKIKKWIWIDYGITVMVEMDNQWGHFAEKLENISFEKISADMFVLPKGVHIAIQ